MEETVRNLIGTHLLDDAGRKVLAQTDNDESLVDAGLLDSLGMVQLVEHMERELSVVLDPMDIAIENLESVDKIVELINAKK